MRHRLWQNLREAQSPEGGWMEQVSNLAPSNTTNKVGYAPRCLWTKQDPNGAATIPTGVYINVGTKVIANWVLLAGQA